MKLLLSCGKIVSVLIIIVLFIVTLWMYSCAEKTMPTSKPATSSTFTPNAPQYGGTLRVRAGVEGVSIGFPAKATSGAGLIGTLPAVEKLLDTNVTGELIPKLASDYKTDTDLKTITLTLRKGIKFHDGTDFNADVAKWNLDQCKTNKVAGTTAWKSVDIIDDYIIRITLSDWDSTAIIALSEKAGLMVSQEAYKKNGEAWAANNPVGTGAFRFISWIKDVQTSYKKFDGYWQKGKPYVDAIEYKIIVDANTAEISLRGGELDLLGQANLTNLKQLEKEGFAIDRNFGTPFGLTLWPDSKNSNSPWSNLKVRQAAQYAIDTDMICKSLTYGYYAPANQLVGKGNWGWNPDVVGYPYNPAKAKQLLAEAGYPAGFKTKMSTRNASITDPIFGAVQNYLKDIGIEAEWERMSNTALDQKITSGWDGLVQGTAGSSSDCTIDLVGRYLGPPYTNWFKNIAVPDDYRQAVLSAVKAGEFETKKKSIQEAIKLMTDKYCMNINIYSANNIFVRAPLLHDYGWFTTPNMVQWTPESAWFEKKK